MLQVSGQFLILFALLCLRPILGNDCTVRNKFFSSDLYKQSKDKTPHNFILSPFSVELILALVEAGAKDDTSKEIKRALRLPNTDEEIKQVIEGYFKSLKSDGKYLKTHTVNKIYIKQELAIKSRFRKVATKVYGGEIERMNFTKNTQAANVINKWVEKQTEKKIKHFLKPDTIKGASAVLVNALYLQSEWSNKFRVSKTKSKDFYTAEKKTVSTLTMHDIGKYDYCERSDWRAKLLKIPLKAKDASLVIVLPNSRDGLGSLENKPQVFSEQEYERFTVKLSLPKFQIETSIQFNELLKKIGIKKIFSRQADLSGIAGRKGDLYIGPVLQKAFISVDEKGVEAGAAGAAVIAPGVVLNLTGSKEFYVNHPFIFYIQVNDIVLFTGRILDPRK